MIEVAANAAAVSAASSDPENLHEIDKINWEIEN